MTRWEAAEILSSRDGFGVPCGYTAGYADAISMAIDALKQSREPATIEFSMAETALTERALHEYMRRNMCRSDRNICESAFSKLQLSKRGREILEAQRQHLGE